MQSLRKAEAFLLFSCLLFLPTQLGKHFWFSFSYVFSLPIDYLSPTLYFWDILALGLVTVWLLRRPSVNYLALSLLLFFLLSQSLSLLFPLNFFGGLFKLEQLTIAGLFGVYLASQDVKQITFRLLPPIFIAAIFESLLSLLQFSVGRSVGLWILGERTFDVSTPVIAKFSWFNQILLRPYGTFPHPNVLAAYLLISLPFLLLIKQARVKLLLSLVVGITTLATFSRVAIVLLFVYTLPFLRKRLKLFLILFIIFAPLILIRFSSALNFDSLSLIRREELADVALKAFLSSPILGVGLGSFINYASTSSVIAGPSRFLQPVHNIFLLSLSETGLVGFMGLLSVSTVAIRNVIKIKRTSLFRSLVFGWVVIIFFGMFDHFFLTLAQGQRLFFMIWGLSMLQFVRGDS